jgi:hypothetical protein
VARKIKIAIKIDVEGGEWAVLRGMEAVLRHRDVPVEVVVALSPRTVA